MADEPLLGRHLYIGGGVRGCAQPNLTADWVSRVNNVGFNFVPTWVGPQEPCNSEVGYRMSWDSNTAYNQGSSVAYAATNDADAKCPGAPQVTQGGCRSTLPQLLHTTDGGFSWTPIVP